MDESEFKDRMGRLSRIVQANRENGNKSEARQCLCRICGHRWNARTESGRPRTCPSCRSSLWDRKELRAVLSLRPRMEDLSPALSPLSFLYIGQVGSKDRGREVQEVFLGMVRSAVR